jgi:hypothetical protein
MLHKTLLILCTIGVGCSSRASATVAVGDADTCFTDPLGRSPPAAQCLRNLPTADDCSSAAPRYDLDIMPIVETRCALCHSPGAVAGRIVFDSYEQAYASYKLMYTQVYTCQMPPSCAGELPDEERQTLLKWFVCKAPPGPTELADGGGADASGP